MKPAARPKTSRTISRFIAFGFGASLALGMFAAPAFSQLFDERFFPFDQRPSRGLFQQNAPQRPADSSHAPSPRKYEKNEASDLSTVVVMGDSMADWLGYGLESSFSESPDITVLRKYRSGSSLIFNEPGRGPRSKQFDWAAAAKEILAKESGSVVVMMIGLSDREPIREVRPATPAKPAPGARNAPAAKPADATKPADPKVADAKPATAKPAEPAKPQVAEAPADKPDADDDDQAVAEQAPRGGTGTYEFRSEKWLEAYNKRLDDVMAALKSKNVPVIWVGLPPVRGPRAMADMAFLNDIYKARAEKAGIYYVDVWDAFVDEGGKFAQFGPDFAGQNRRLRASDGVYFTQAGARKLAHYVEKEIRRAMMPSGPIAIPLPVEPGMQGASAPVPAPDQTMPRPLAGPVIPLNASGDNFTEAEELAGVGGSKQVVGDVIASSVLAKGDALPVPAGRADDFVWPRRGPAPLNADPVVARTSIPMTPMLAERPGMTKVAAVPEKQRPRVARTAANSPREQQRDPRRQQQTPPPFFFFFSR